MKTLIIKSKIIKPSETFILDHANKLKDKTILIHGETPTKYNKNISELKINLQLITNKLAKRYGKQNNILYKYYFSRVLKKIRPDVVLAEYGTTASKIYRICEKRNIPLIIHFHGYDAHLKSDVQENWIDYKKMFSSCRAVIAVSKNMRSALIEIGANPNITFINPCGVDVSKFQFNHVEKSKKYFLSVGRFVEKKAPQITLFAFYKFQKQYPDIKLIMIGDGPLLNACKDLSTALGIDEKVEFLGVQPHDTVQEYMKNASAYIQHSITAHDGDSEGSPVSIAEAGACGLPVISTYHAGISDIVIHESTGFLINEKDADSMAAYMSKLISDQDNAREMGRKARKHIENYYSQDYIISRLQNIIEWSVGKKDESPSLFPCHIEE